jgi:hypothetical protein
MPQVARKIQQNRRCYFDVDEEHKLAIKQNLRSKVVLEKIFRSTQYDVCVQYRDFTEAKAFNWVTILIVVCVILNV